MSNDPDQIRADIERTRASLSENVNTLTDTVAPSHIAKRQADKARTAVFGVRDKVMGTAADLGSSASDTASGMSDAVTGAPGTIKAQAAGNPLAAGLIALGIGWLVGSLLPAGSAEKQAAAQVKETATPLVTDAATEVADHLKEPAQEAVASVTDAATSAATTVKEEGMSSAQAVKDKAAQAKDTVQESRS
jgi:hypothetical protein